MLFVFNDKGQHAFLVPQIQSFRLCENVLFVERVAESGANIFLLSYEDKKKAQSDHNALAEKIANFYAEEKESGGNKMGFLSEACGFPLEAETEFDFDDEDDDEEDNGGGYVQ